ncbi:MAG: hypothetical protein K8S16_01390 [Bacteroidales bacterium]|nr:hypothetical protein [Bacteroidales bacterium]
MENTQSNNSQQTPITQVPLPNGTAVLALGITSIVLCWCHGIIGLILAIIALTLANRDLALYNLNPGQYTPGSLSNVRNGRTIAIIGLVLAGIFLFILLISFLFLGLNFALFPWKWFKI